MDTMTSFDAYTAEVAREQAAQPDQKPGRVAYAVLVEVAPRLAFTVTDDHQLNPCHDQSRLPAFFDFTREAMQG